jgi:hypothetical protein
MIAKGLKKNMSEAKKKPEDQVIAAHRGQAVILFADIHSIADAVYDAAIATALKLKKPFGTEIIGGPSLIYIDGYKKGEITREQYLDYVVPKDSVPMPGSGTYFLGHKRFREMMGRIADAVKDKGLEIVPLSTSLGVIPGANTKEKAEIFDESSFLMASLQYKGDRLFQKEKAAIERDPKKYYEGYVATVMQNFNGLGAVQKKTVSEIMGHEKTKPSDYVFAIKQMQMILLPEVEQMQALEKKAKKTMDAEPSEDPKEFRWGMSDKDIEVRASQDAAVGQKIKGFIDKDKRGMVVAFGGGHTVEKAGRKGLDIDGELRRLGVKVMIVDPVVKLDQLCDPLACRSARVKSGIVDLYRTFIKAAAAEGDPSRVAVNYDLSGYLSVPLPAAGARKPESAVIH